MSSRVTEAREPDRGIDVAGNAQVDDEHGAGDAGKVCRREHVGLGGHGGEHDIGVGQLGVDALETAGAQLGRLARLAHEGLGTGQGTVDHHDAAGRGRRGDVAECPGDPQAHRTGADDDDPLVPQALAAPPRGPP